MKKKNLNASLVKLVWEDVREDVSKVNPELARIIDAINPDHTFPLYKANYPYGMIIGDDINFYYPNNQQKFVRLQDGLPNEAVKHLEYAGNSIPTGLVLKNTVELFMEHDGRSIPRRIYSPGTIFALPRELDSEYGSYHPSGLLNMSSGARSIFLLPNIGNAVHHARIQKKLGINLPAPKNAHEHWKLFREIISLERSSCDWSSSLLYFSKKWIDKIHNDKKWIALKLFFHKTAWEISGFSRNKIYFDYIFSIIQKNKNLKPNPYISDTANHLLSIAVGSSPGFAPATNEKFAPIKFLQDIFITYYGIQYMPTLFQPSIFKPLFENKPIYYSLQYPTTLIFSPKSRKTPNTLYELRELKYISEILFKEISSDNALCRNTIVSTIAKNIYLEFFHSKRDPLNAIKPTVEMQKNDARLLPSCLPAKSELRFSESAEFVRGCVRMSVKSK